ncbi:hypothetical protein MJ561_07440 [Klebsiella pneumoniae]|nr:hypothetical protein MJ561_07440 [Klebsiella pneumoniae]
MACWCADVDALQRASELDTLLDKTGTLTEGKPQVVAVEISLALMSIPRCVCRRADSSSHRHDP